MCINSCYTEANTYDSKTEDNGCCLDVLTYRYSKWQSHTVVEENHKYNLNIGSVDYDLWQDDHDMCSGDGMTLIV